MGAVPTWAPDGSRLAFVRAETGRPNVWNLWLLSLDSGETQRLTSYRYSQTWGASWFPGGERIVYTHETTLVVRDLVTGATREFKSPIPKRLVRTAAVSPDGRRVIFQVHRDGAWLLGLADGSMRRVLADPSAEEFSWAPDGTRVAFHSRRGGRWGVQVAWFPG
jgi:Tol biopolymer transport system component